MQTVGKVAWAGMIVILHLLVQWHLFTTRNEK